MSMLSAQCDELRAMAESVGLAMPQAATMMMGAADAIDHLDAENAKLRELLQASLRDFRRIYDYDEQDGWQMVDAIDRMVIGMRKLGFDVGRTEQELRIEVN